MGAVRFPGANVLLEPLSPEHRADLRNVRILFKIQTTPTPEEAFAAGDRTFLSS
jgi:hypothetical protein